MLKFLFEYFSLKKIKIAKMSYSYYFCYNETYYAASRVEYEAVWSSVYSKHNIMTKPPDLNSIKMENETLIKCEQLWSLM